MISHSAPISGISASPDAHYVATAGYDNQVILWDAATRRALSRVNHDHLANQLAFSADGRYLVTSSSDYTARLWAMPDMRLVSVMSVHDDDVEMAAFHPSKRLIATASRDHQVRVFDYSGRLITLFQGHEADVISVAWGNRDDLLLSSSDDGTVRIWSIESPGQSKIIDLGGIETDTIAVTETGVILAGNDDGKIVLIDGDDKEEISAHKAGIKRLVYDPAHKLLISLSYDRSMKIWSLGGRNIEALAESTLPPIIWPRSGAFLGRGKVVLATFGSEYAEYDIESNTWRIEGIEPTHGINALLSVDDGLKTVGDAGIVRIDGNFYRSLGSLCNFLVKVGTKTLAGGQMGAVYDADTGDVIYQHRSPLNCAASFLRGGAPHTVIGTYTGEGLVFRCTSAGAVEFVCSIPLHNNAVKGVAASDTTVFAVCADTGASWFSIADFTEIARMKNAHDKIVNGCTALPDGRFGSISRDLTLRLWHGTQCLTVKTPHDHSIKCIAASSDGQFIATASYNGTVAIYDAIHKEWLPIVRPTAAGISSIIPYASNGFIAASYDGRTYRLSSTH